MTENSLSIFVFYFILFYNIVLVLPYIKMNLPQVYMCSPSWTLLPPISNHFRASSDIICVCVLHHIHLAGWGREWDVSNLWQKVLSNERAEPHWLCCSGWTQRVWYTQQSPWHRVVAGKRKTLHLQCFMQFNAIHLRNVCHASGIVLGAWVLAKYRVVIFTEPTIWLRR